MRKPVPGFEGLYEVSEDGRVFSLDRVTVGKGKRKLRELKRTPTSHGYVTVALSGNGKRGNRYVHQLVLEAFDGKSPLESRHLNGSKKENQISNLAWGSHAQNVEDNHRLGAYLKGQRHPHHKLKDSDVVAMRLIRGLTQKQIGKKFGVHQRTVCRILRREAWKHIA